MGLSDIPPYSPALRDLEARARGKKWAEKALECECKILAGTASGRNTALNNAALKLGHKVGGGYLDAAEVTARLYSAAEQNGYVAKDGPEATLATIESGLTAGIAEPEHPGDRPRLTAVPPDGGSACSEGAGSD